MSKVECGACHGTGKRPLPSGELRSCRACDGTGDYRYAPAITSIEAKIRVADKAAPPVGSSRTGGLVKGLDVKLYPEVRPWEVEPHYSRHVGAMTSEGLHAKAEIAEQLALRDKHLDELRAELVETRARLARARAAWWLQREVHYSLRVPSSDLDSLDAFWDRVEAVRMLRAVRLCRFFRERFEREAEAMVKGGE